MYMNNTNSIGTWGVGRKNPLTVWAPERAHPSCGGRYVCVGEHLVLGFGTSSVEVGSAAPRYPFPNEGYHSTCTMSVPLCGDNHARPARLE